MGEYGPAPQEVIEAAEEFGKQQASVEISPTPEELEQQPEQPEESSEDLEAKKKEIRERLVLETANKLFTRFEELMQDQEDISFLYHQGTQKNGETLNLNLGNFSVNFQPELVESMMKAFWENQNDSVNFAQALKAGLELVESFDDFLDKAAEQEAKGETLEQGEVVEIGADGEVASTENAEPSEVPQVDEETLPGQDSSDPARV